MDGSESNDNFRTARELASEGINDGTGNLSGSYGERVRRMGTTGAEQETEDNRPTRSRRNTAKKKGTGEGKMARVITDMFGRLEVHLVEVEGDELEEVEEARWSDANCPVLAGSFVTRGGLGHQHGGRNWRRNGEDSMDMGQKED